MTLVIKISKLWHFAQWCNIFFAIIFLCIGCQSFVKWRRSLFALLPVCPAPLGKQQVGDRLDVKSLAMPRNISGFAMNSYRDIAILRFFHNDGSTNTQFHRDTCEYRNAKPLIKKLGAWPPGTYQVTSELVCDSACLTGDVTSQKDLWT